MVRGEIFEPPPLLAGGVEERGEFRAAAVLLASSIEAGGAEERESWRAGGGRRVHVRGHRVLGYNDWMRLGAV
jgi:hypothetical protein